MGGRRESITKAFALPLRKRKTSKVANELQLFQTPIDELESVGKLPFNPEAHKDDRSGYEYDLTTEYLSYLIS